MNPAELANPPGVGGENGGENGGIVHAEWQDAENFVPEADTMRLSHPIITAGSNERPLVSLALTDAF